MTNKNHFCIYCGAKLDFNQKFCTQCGKKVQRNNRNVEKIQSRYNDALDAIDEEYEFRQQNAKELLNKLFDSNHFLVCPLCSSNAVISKITYPFLIAIFKFFICNTKYNSRFIPIWFSFGRM